MNHVIEEVIPDYVIITNNELKSAFQRLANWKIKRGVPTIIKTTEEINQEYSGSDLVEKIREYLVEVKKRWNGNSLSILLGGGSDIVPSKIVKSRSSDETSLQVTDIYYVIDTINSFNWNPKDYDYNKHSNELVSSYLGRIPVKTSIEANFFIDKILDYEKMNRLEKSKFSYLNNFLVSDAYMQISDGKISDCGMDQLDAYCKTFKNSSTKYWYIFDHFECTKNDHSSANHNKYDKTYGEELNKNNFLSALRDGRSFGSTPEQFHFIYHMDHSIPKAFGTSSIDKEETVTNDDINNISFSPYYYKIIMSGSCHPADFSRDCVAERFLNKINSGVVAFIGNTDIGYTNEYWQFKQLLKPLFEKNQSNIYQYNIGYLFNCSARFNLDNVRLHLLGDPTMPVWTATPGDLNVTVTPDTIISGSNTITVKINNLPVGQQALVCLMKGDEAYATFTVKDTKEYTIPFAPITSGLVDVTVTAHNYRPFETTIPVKVSGNPVVTISSLRFDDDKTDGSIGNGDGQLDAGETVELTIGLKNSGQMGFNKIVGTLSCNSGHIVVLDSLSEFGPVSSGSTVYSPIKYRFRINKDINEIRRNDLNSIRFMLSMTNGFTPIYTDTFKIDVFAPELELRGSNIQRIIGNQLQLSVSLANVGKAQATGLTATLSSPDNAWVVEGSQAHSSYLDIKRNETSGCIPVFSIPLTDGRYYDKPINFDLEVKNRFGRTWTFRFNTQDKCPAVNSSKISYRPFENTIDLYWEPTDNASGYNIYRSATGPTGNYVKLNDRPLSLTYFKDTEVNFLTAYYYKVSAVSKSGSESLLSDYIKAWTSRRMIGHFPRITATSHRIHGSVNLADVDNDGKKEIFLTERLWNPHGDGYLLGLRHNGEELFDIDGDPASFSGFAKLSTTAMATPAIGDLKGNGEQNIVTVTWQNSSFAEDRNSIACFTANDTDKDGLPDMSWLYDLDTSMSVRGAVLSNLDNSPDGTLELLYRGIGGSGPMKIFDCDGKLKAQWEAGGNETMLAVADLDGDGDKEILASNENSLYIWHHNGRSYGNSPFFTTNKRLSSPVVCDLNNDGVKEILVAEKQTTDSYIYALDLKGDLLNGWNGEGSVTHIPYADYSSDHGLSVGDINGDGLLEVVALGRNAVTAWKNDGSVLFSREIDNLFPDIIYTANFSVPILADVDGDGVSDIVFGSESAVYALHSDGTDVLGFPIQVAFSVNGSVAVSDMDNDGKNELIVTDLGQIYAWKTDGNPHSIEWGSERHDPQNTGEYAPMCEPLLIRSNTVWNGITPCGNVIVQSGTLTVPSGKNLQLSNTTSKIVVRPGATLVVDGGTISNAYVWALAGSSVILKNNGAVLLRNDGKFIIDQGATFNNQYGKVD